MPAFRNEKFELQRERNANAYQLLFEIEVILRELCALKLSALHGKHWAKRGLPTDLLDKVKDALAYEKKTKWHRTTLHHPLYYVDFPDLRKIIIGGLNWNPIFAEIFGQKPGTDASLSELELLRNKVAHNRFVSDVDLEITKGIHSKILGSIPMADLQEIYRAIDEERVPIVSHLTELAGC